MISINPDNIKIISLSLKERKALLEHSQVVEEHILEKISDSPGGQFTLLTSEFELFLAALRYEASNQTPKLQTIFTKLYQRLSIGFASNQTQKNINSDVQEHLQGKDFESIEDLNEELSKFYNNHNSAPDPELGNLSPNQVSSLLYTDWDRENSPIKFNKNMTLEDLKLSRFFNNTRIFLKTLIEFSNEDTATATGNLNRKSVKILFDKLDIETEDRDDIIRYNKVLNEEDVFQLHIIKIICEAAELIHRRSKRIIFKKNYHNLLSDEKAGELYYLLFKAFFKKFNLGYLDRLPDLTELQDTINYSFYRLSTICNKYETVESLHHKILLPKVIENIEMTGMDLIDKTFFIKSRIIQPLEEFGLIECQRAEGNSFSKIKAVKKTGLYDQFMKFRVKR